MVPLIFSLVAIACYLVCSSYQARSILLRKRVDSKLVMGLAGAAITAHTIDLSHLIFTQQGVNLGFFRVPSLIFWLISSLLFFSSIKKPIENLFVPVFALTAIAIIVSISFDTPYTPIKDLSIEVTTHILLSILAYSVFTVAAIQAVILAYQDRQLKQRHTRSIIHALPPLQTMENLLFEMILSGVILLSLSILSGFLFLEDLFAQHVAHKTVFSICAWGIFTTLLWGHYRWGWRGTTALKWTLAGFIALMLAFFGTKFVLELLL